MRACLSVVAAALAWLAVSAGIASAATTITRYDIDMSHPEVSGSGFIVVRDDGSFSGNLQVLSASLILARETYTSSDVHVSPLFFEGNGVPLYRYGLGLGSNGNALTLTHGTKDFMLVWQQKRGANEFGFDPNAYRFDLIVSSTSGVSFHGSDYTPGVTVLATAVPEPSAWAFMITALGLVGIALRSRSTHRARLRSVGRGSGS